MVVAEIVPQQGDGHHQRRFAPAVGLDAGGKLRLVLRVNVLLQITHDVLQHVYIAFAVDPSFQGGHQFFSVFIGKAFYPVTG